MEQSPKAKRAHGPSEREPQDNPPYTETPHKVGPQGPSGRGPSVPNLNFGNAGNQGGIQSGPASKATSSPAPDSAGSPGYVESEDAKRTGGTFERFGTDRGNNS